MVSKKNLKLISLNLAFQNNICRLQFKLLTLSLSKNERFGEFKINKYIYSQAHH